MAEALKIRADEPAFLVRVVIATIVSRRLTMGLSRDFVPQTLKPNLSRRLKSADHSDPPALRVWLWADYLSLIK